MARIVTLPREPAAAGWWSFWRSWSATCWVEVIGSLLTNSLALLADAGAIS